MSPRRRADDDAPWLPDTWRATLRPDAALYPRLSVLVVGDSELAIDTLRRVHDDPHLLLAGPLITPEQARPALSAIRPDFGLLCGADERVLEVIAGELDVEDEAPATRLAAVVAFPDRYRCLPRDHVVPTERELLDGLFAAGRR